MNEYWYWQQVEQSRAKDMGKYVYYADQDVAGLILGIDAPVSLWMKKRLWRDILKELDTALAGMLA